MTFNGATVATGTLDASGHAMLNFTADVPRGATVQVSAGGKTATLVLAFDTDETILTVVDNGDGTLTVTATDANGAENENDTEDDNGNETEVDDNGGMGALPSNLPISISASCTSLSLSATGSQVAFIDFFEKTDDGEDDNSAEIRVQNLPFSTTQNNPLVEPIVFGAARIEVDLFNASGQQILRIRGPLQVFTALANGGATPSACPRASAGPTANPSGSPTAEPSESPEPTGSPAPSASPQPTGSSGSH